MLVVSVVASSAALAKPSKGELEILNWENREGTVKIPVMKVRYDFSIFFEEPTEKFIFYYNPIDDFTRIFTIKLRARLYIGEMGQDAYVTFDPLVTSPGEWSWDVAGSPDWTKTFFTDGDTPVSAEKAKELFRKGFTLRDLEVLEIEARNGVDDAAYDSFAASLPAVFVVGENEPMPLDGKLPNPNMNSAFGGGTSNDNLWKDRLTGTDFGWIMGGLEELNSSDNLIVENEAILGWKYGKYHHSALEMEFAGIGEDGVGSNVEIAVSWHNPGTGFEPVRTRKFTRKVLPGQRMVILDKILRLAEPGEPLPSYLIGHKLRFLDDDEKPEDEIEADDPVVKKAEEDELRKALNHEERKRSGDNAEWMYLTRKGAAENVAENAQKDADSERKVVEQLAGALAITSPQDGHRSNKNVVFVEGRIDTEFFNSRGGRYYLSTNGQTQQFAVSSSGAFRSAVVLGAGPNEVKLVGEVGSASAEVTKGIHYTGPRSRLRATLTWDNGNSDIDLYVKDPAGNEVSYQNKEQGSMSLDVDNTKGYGPENISVPSALTGDYRISAKNFSRGNGVTATIHVFVDERLENTYSHTFYRNGEQWIATRVTMR